MTGGGGGGSGGNAVGGLILVGGGGGGRTVGGRIGPLPGLAADPPLANAVLGGAGNGPLGGDGRAAFIRAIGAAALRGIVANRLGGGGGAGEETSC